MRNAILYLVSYVLAFAVVAALLFGAWKLERWVNWKLDYSRRTEQRIKQLEQRVAALEVRCPDAKDDE